MFQLHVAQILLTWMFRNSRERFSGISLCAKKHVVVKGRDVVSSSTSGHTKPVFAIHSI